MGTVASIPLCLDDEDNRPDDKTNIKLVHDTCGGDNAAPKAGQTPERITNDDDK